MTEGQLSLFAQSRLLVDVPLLDRLRGAEALLDTTATDLEMREALLALVAWPAAWSEAER
jgi:hypothetical protein